MAVMTVTDTSFEADVLNADTPVVVDFWAEWCGPCKQIAPVLEEISGEMEGKVAIAKINVDDNPNVAAKYGIRGLPTLMMFKGGELVAAKPGANAKGVYVNWINENS